MTTRLDTRPGWGQPPPWHKVNDQTFSAIRATLHTRGILYDRINRGGILNIRYSQFTPEVVRVVIELESLRDYRLEHADDAVRIAIGTDRGFTAWSSVAPPFAMSMARTAPLRSSRGCRSC